MNKKNKDKGQRIYLTQSQANNSYNSEKNCLSNAYQNVTELKSIVYRPFRIIPNTDDYSAGTRGKARGNISLLYPIYKNEDNETTGTILALVAAIFKANDFEYTYTMGGIGITNPYAINFNCKYMQDNESHEEYFRIGALSTVEASNIAISGDITINGKSLKTLLGIT